MIFIDLFFIILHIIYNTNFNLGAGSFISAVYTNLIGINAAFHGILSNNKYIDVIILFRL